MAAKILVPVRCTRSRCFANNGDRCILLRLRTKRQPCPFFRDITELQEEDLRIYGRVEHWKIEERKGC